MSTPKVYGALSTLQQSLEAIPKGKQMAFGERYYYRGIDDVQAAVFPAMQEAGLMLIDYDLDYQVVPSVSKSGASQMHVLVKYKGAWVSLEDGSRLEFVALGEGIDATDKAANKAKANAIKYAILHQFAIPTENPVDPDGMVTSSAQEADLLAAAARCKTREELLELYTSAGKPAHLANNFKSLAEKLTKP